MCGAGQQGSEPSGAVSRSPPAARGGGPSAPAPAPHTNPDRSRSPAARPLPQPPPRVTASRRGPRPLRSYLRLARCQLPLPLLVLHGVCRVGRDAAERKDLFRKRRTELRGHSGRAGRSPAARAGLHGPRGHRRHLRLHVNTRRPAGRGGAERAGGRSAQPRAWPAGACARPARPGRGAQRRAARQPRLPGSGAANTPHCVSRFRSDGGLITGSRRGEGEGGTPRPGEAGGAPAPSVTPNPARSSPTGSLSTHGLRPPRRAGRTVCSQSLLPTLCSLE